MDVASIEVQGICKSYRKIRALEDVSLHIGEARARLRFSEF